MPVLRRPCLLAHSLHLSALGGAWRMFPLRRLAMCGDDDGGNVEDVAVAATSLFSSSSRGTSKRETHREEVKLASKRFLAGSLGVAAGVMLYVSLVEIFVKSQDSFVNAGHDKAPAYTYASVSLFGGILFYKGIDILVHMLDGSAGDCNVDINLYDLDASSDGTPAVREGKGSATPVGGKHSTLIGSRAPHPSSGVETDLGKPSAAGSQGAQPQFPHEHDVVVELNSGNTVRPSADLHTLHLQMAGKVQQPPESPAAALTPPEPKATDDLGTTEEGKTGDLAPATANDEARATTLGDLKLVRMGLMTAVAIGIHNFPEGLATFVGALSDPSVGAALAVAIAIHNIPEGLCVAIPVYYATGNRWKAFGWALLSGISEPIGAGLGWIILKDNMNETAYGILFGLVAGMMVNISIHELIPTAVRYDPADKVTTNSIIAGMTIMAISLLLFVY